MMAIDTTPISPTSKVILPASERLEKSDSRGMGESGSKRSLARQLLVQSPVQGTHSIAVCVHTNWPKVAAFSFTLVQLTIPAAAVSPATWQAHLRGHSFGFL